MNNRRNRKLAAVVSLVLVLLIIPLLATACEPIAPFKILNNTDRTITLLVNGTVEGTISPHSEFKPRSIFVSGQFTIEAKEPQGTVIYSQKLSLEELEWLDWKILIPASSQ